MMDIFITGNNNWYTCQMENMKYIMRKSSSSPYNFFVL